MPAPVTITCRLAVAGHTYYSLKHDPAEELVARERVSHLIDAVLSGVTRGAAGAIQSCLQCDPPMVESLPSLVLLSNLAPGTDQLAADRALKAQFDLAAILPSHVDAYASVMRDEAARTLRQLVQHEACRACVELDEVFPTGASTEDEEHRQRAYKIAGHVALQNADFLLAVYDDDSGRPTSSGGTAEMVRRARETGIPIFWIHPRRATVQVGLDPNDILSWVLRNACKTRLPALCDVN